MEREDRRRNERERLEAVAAAGLRTDREWLRAHRDQVNELADLELEIARRTRMAGRAAEVDRPEHVIAMLGDPPVDLDARERWRRAAGAIESHSARWGAAPDLSEDGRETELDTTQDAHLESVAQAVAATVAESASMANDTTDTALELQPAGTPSETR
jgi:hypothetical protein